MALPVFGVGEQRLVGRANQNEVLSVSECVGMCSSGCLFIISLVRCSNVIIEICQYVNFVVCYVPVQRNLKKFKNISPVHTIS